MSQVRLCPVTSTGVPNSRREASRTVANTSGNRSSSVACSALASACSALPSWSLSVARSAASGQSCLALVRRSTSVASAPVRSATLARNFALCACSSPSENVLRRSSCRWIALTVGLMRFISRLKRVPKIFLKKSSNISPLLIQPVGGDVLAHRVGHPLANGPPRRDPRADRRSGHVERRHLDHPGEQPVGRDGRPRPGENDHVGEPRQGLDLVPVGQILRG